MPEPVWLSTLGLQPLNPLRTGEMGVQLTGIWRDGRGSMQGGERRTDVLFYGEDRLRIDLFLSS